MDDSYHYGRLSLARFTFSSSFLLSVSLSSFFFLFSTVVFGEIDGAVFLLIIWFFLRIPSPFLITFWTFALWRSRHGGNLFLLSLFANPSFFSLALAGVDFGGYRFVVMVVASPCDHVSIPLAFFPPTADFMIRNAVRFRHLPFVRSLMDANSGSFFNDGC